MVVGLAVTDLRWPLRVVSMLTDLEGPARPAGCRGTTGYDGPGRQGRQGQAGMGMRSTGDSAGHVVLGGP
jgi:hypothetical protein